MYFQFLYSQDLSNCTTKDLDFDDLEEFLYSQDLSNCTTRAGNNWTTKPFLYSQDLSNCTTAIQFIDLLLLWYVHTKNRSAERVSSILAFLQYPCTDGMGYARFVICFGNVFGDFFEFWISIFHNNGVSNDFQHGAVIFFVPDCHGFIFGQS